MSNRDGMGFTALVAVGSRELRRRLCGAMLDREVRCSVFEADSGSTAMELFLRFQPEVVLLDAAFEDLNGFDLLLRMKQVRPEAAIILMVGTSDPFVRNVGRRLGASEFCQKNEDLGRVIEVAGQLARARGGRKDLPGIHLP